MGSLAEPRYCANEARCVNYDSATHKPEKLSRYNNKLVCEACQREDGASTPVAPPEHAELFRFARLLFDEGIEDEDQIIPTLVFAANLSEMSHLRELRDTVAALDDQDENWDDLRGKFSYFFDKMVLLPKTIDGAPILQLQPFTMTSITNKQGYVEEVDIDVFMRSV